MFDVHTALYLTVSEFPDPDCSVTVAMDDVVNPVIVTAIVPELNVACAALSSIKLFSVLNVVLLAIVSVAAEAGAVIVTLLIVVAVAAPKVGVVSVGDVLNTILVDVVPVVPAAEVRKFNLVAVVVKDTAPIVNGVGIVTVPVKVGDANLA